ncbi:tetratricopeptide repeat protein [Streptomyces sp. NPDC020965]|uniref:tetratricopeptide repeat protein n=1 Tax=Streptomyces sp. NPDC020965 TaxID=3365105 RepID=UPI0037B49D22
MASSARTARAVPAPAPAPGPAPGQPHAVPNLPFRRLRGSLSPGEFAAVVRKAAREIDERVCCDARYVGRVEAGEIRCPNYAYERVFLHMYPGLTLADLGFMARERVRGGRRKRSPGREPAPSAAEFGDGRTDGEGDEETNVLRRAFMTSGSATMAAASFGLGSGLGLGSVLRAGGDPGDTAPARRRVGEPEVAAVEEAVRRIRLLDDRYGANGLYQRAAQPLRAAYALLDAGISTRRETTDRLHSGAGELTLSVGWLAHDSGHFDEARSHYAEALATARVAGDPALEAHAFSNISFLARDAGRHREAVLAAQAGLRAAGGLDFPRLRSLLALREAGGWAGLGDRGECERALTRARGYFGRGTGAPEWMSFFGEPELELLEGQCWSTMGAWPRAARHSRRAASLQDRGFTRNLALYRAELAVNLAHGGAPDESAEAGHQVLDLLDRVQSARIQSLLTTTATVLRPYGATPGVPEFLARRGELVRGV